MKNNKHEYDRLAHELSRNNIPYDITQKLKTEATIIRQ